jgi:hypothetical protein
MNQKLVDRLEGMQAAATCAGPRALSEWSALWEGVHTDEVSFAAVRDFGLRLQKMPRVNDLDKTLPPEKRRLVLPNSPPAEDDLSQLERAASEACGFWVGRAKQ